MRRHVVEISDHIVSVDPETTNTFLLPSSIRGSLELGPLGGAKRLGRKRYAIRAFASTTCGALALFVDSDS